MSASEPSRFLGLHEKGFPNTALPIHLVGHPFVSSGPFFTLPAELLDLLQAEIGITAFEAELLAIERTLSTICALHTERIGFWGSAPIEFALLRIPLSRSQDEVLIEWMASNGEQGKERSETHRQVLKNREAFRVVARGYLGWLLTNPLFQLEHRVMFEKWHEITKEYGPPKMGPVVRTAQDHNASLADGQMRLFILDFEAFYVRWRLEGMAAPFAPLPLQPQLPIADLRPVLGHMKDGGLSFYLPDTYPVPSRDDLRFAIEQALRGPSPPEHLSEWTAIVRAGNSSRKQIERYGRQFEIQHYLRALYSRHAQSLIRKRTAVIAALSSFLNKGTDMIGKDIREMEERLGIDLTPSC